jgi:hypothetical protein
VKNKSKIYKMKGAYLEFESWVKSTVPTTKVQMSVAMRRERSKSGLIAT